MITIEHFNTKHLDQLYEVEKDSFLTPWSKNELERDALQNDKSIYYVALENDNVIGYAAMWHIVNEGHITNIAVKSEYRQKGIGALLVAELITFAQKKEMIGITLEVRVSNIAAQKLYEKFGFKPEGVRKKYYKDTNEDAIIMWKWL